MKEVVEKKWKVKEFFLLHLRLLGSIQGMVAAEIAKDVEELLIVKLAALASVNCILLGRPQ